jgi:transcriptional regulator with XRE-family HTH domain
VQSELPPNRLRELRESKGIKRYDLAARWRVDPSTIARWERGETPMPDVCKLDLAALYGVSVPHLMGWPEPAAA